MTEYKLQDGWMDKAKEKVYYDGKYLRRMSRKNEKLLLKLITNSYYLGNNNNMSSYEYRG